MFVDKKAPIGEWVSDGEVVRNGGYTNRPLSFTFTEPGATATISKNGGEYASYASGTVLTDDATYNLVLKDLAGNKSNFCACVDTVCPTGQLYADYKSVSSGAVTNGVVYFTWDGDITATVNGAPYVKNTMLAEDSEYRFVLTDFAGNESKYVITVDTVSPTYNQDRLNGSTQLKSKWYLVNADGTLHSFATYDEALAFACEKEYAKCVTELLLENISDFNQYHLVADNGSVENTDDNVREGAYWLYKSKANPDSLLYYFDRNLLSEVIAHYAKANVSEVKYLLPDGENEYGSVSENMGDNKLVASDGTVAPALNGFIFDKADGTELFAELVGGDGSRIKLEYGVAFDEQILVGGLYKLNEIDAAQNETVFYGFYDFCAPELKVTATIFGNSESMDLTIAKGSLTGTAAYYYERFEVKEIVDADKWSVLAITDNGAVSYFTFGDELPCLDKGGEYLISLYDRFGNSFSFTVYIVGNPAVVEFGNNGDNTEFGLSITLEQKFDTLVSIEIRRNGEPLANVSTDKLNYTFDKAGLYIVKLRDNFGRVIEKEYNFIKALPDGILEGVENGGKTKNDVHFTYDNSKYYTYITKNGQRLDIADSGAITINANDASSGSYVIRLIRLTDDENFTEYSFTVNTLKPEFDLSIENGVTTNKNVSVSWKQKDIVSVTYTLNDGAEVALENCSELSAEGRYFIKATNDLGTVSEKTFVIDKTLDYYVAINEQEITNAEATNEKVAVFNNEPLYIAVTKNGEAYDYEFGDVISEEGYFSFRIYDDYNNTVSFGILVDKSVDFETNVGNGMITNDNVNFTNSEKLSVTMMKDNAVIDYTFGQSLTEEGEYKAVLKDSYGNEKTISFRIVKGIKRGIDYALGENVEIISVLKDGNFIETEGNRLNFGEDGVYSVTAKADGKTYTFELALDATAPTVILNGVEDGGVGHGKVTITDMSESGTIEVYKNGERIEYELGEELKDYADYEVRVFDELGNERVYSFTLNYKMPGIFIALIVVACVAAVGVGVFFILRKKKIIK